ncbi:MAG: sugar phosphate isomerase/epimerase [Candidatus Aminicenantes bacterium]|nr:sugar phosphate isomerase/epimerase [Candidatus Aminicenantes bacterium]
MRIGIDNYGLQPLGLTPEQTLRWALENGAEGVHFSGLEPEYEKKLEKAVLRDLCCFAAENNLYLEWGGGQHLPFDTQTWKPRDIFRGNRRAAFQALQLGTRIVRSCSGGMMRWDAKSPMTETLLLAAARSLKEQQHMLRDHNVILALETHFEFTTWEILRLFDMCDAEPGDTLGICLDPMNLLIMLEDPGAATERVLPWVVCTHFKDGGLHLSSEGLTVFPTGTGRGVVDLAGIAKKLSLLPHDVNLSIEDHGGSFLLPVFDPLFLSKFPDLCVQELTCIIQMAMAKKEKNKSKKSVPLPREDWPKVCEDRMKTNIRYLKRLIFPVEGV